MPQRLPWNPWICPRDKAIRFDDRGYPEEPGGRYAAVVQPDCVALEAVLAERCGVHCNLDSSDVARYQEADRLSQLVLSLRDEIRVVLNAQRVQH